MSSSTEPYQPIEHKKKLTRSFLEVMVEDRGGIVSRETPYRERSKSKGSEPHKIKYGTRIVYETLPADLM